ncbi:MAG: germination protein YpeB [Clostridia bacterium]|nr:germination protein YpeB [Clostridia bacterium]
MRRKQWLWLFAVFAVSLVTSAGLTVYSYQRARRYARWISDAYEGVLLTSMMQMEQLRLNIDKAILSRDEGQNAVLLGKIGSDAAAVHAQLSALPLAHSAMAEAVKMCNQMSGYAAALQEKAMETLPEEDAQTLEKLSQSCAQLLEHLQSAYGQMQDRNVRFDRAQVYMLDADSKARPLEDMSGRIDYPTLIYDGPFSDVVSENAPRGLGKKEIPRSEAAAVARGYLGEAALSAELTQECGGTIPAWGVKVETDDCTLQMAVTKQGGDVLWMFPENADFALKYGLEECKKAAEEFLSVHGYGDMHLTFWQIYGGMATLSYAAVQEGVVLYPDLIKVQVRMDTLEAVGIEARHYLTSHVRRENLTPAVSEKEARQAISNRMSNVSSQLCVIPQNGREYLCWEFTGDYNGNTYYVYIDAMTGRQRDIQRLVQTQFGPKAS